MLGRSMHTTVAALAVAGIVSALSASGAGAGASPVLHAVLDRANRKVEVWKDPASGAFAFRTSVGDRAENGVEILRGRTLAVTADGQLTALATYRTAAAGWKPIELRYGVNHAQAEAALAAGERTERPALMNVPDPANSASAYTRVLDFGTDVAALRRSVRFSVPAPGRRLAGLTLATTELVRRLGPRKLVDSGPLATLFYSSDPDHLGVNDRQLVVNTASRRSGYGTDYARFFAGSTVRLKGVRYELHLVDGNVGILPYGDSYVSLRATWTPTRVQWHAIAAQVTR